MKQDERTGDSTEALRSALEKIDEATSDPARDGDFLDLLDFISTTARAALSSSPPPSLREALEKIAALADRNCGATDENFDYALGSAHAFTEAAAIARTALAGVTANKTEVTG